MALNKLIKYLITIFIIKLSLNSIANATIKDDIIIDIYQGSEPGTSYIEVVWPDGKIERLLFKDKDIEDGNEGYLNWFDDRMTDYFRRTRKKEF